MYIFSNTLYIFLQVYHGLAAIQYGRVACVGGKHLLECLSDARWFETGSRQVRDRIRDQGIEGVERVEGTCKVLGCGIRGWV